MNDIRILMLGMGLMCICQLSFGQDQNLRKPELSRAPLERRKVDPVEQERLQRDHYRRQLGIDSAKAGQVNKVQSDFKASVKGLASDKILVGESRLVQLKILIEERNRKLLVFLSQEQLEKLIPSTERDQSKK